MTTIEFRTPVQTADVATEKPALGPTLIDPSLFQLVSGGLPKGGWEGDPPIEYRTPTPEAGSA